MPELTLTLTLCPLQSRLQHIYHGQPYARVDLNPRPESTVSPSQGLWIYTQLCCMKVGYQILEINDAPPKWAGYYLWSLFWGRESEKLVLGFTPKEHL